MQDFHRLVGGTSLVMALGNRRTDLHALNNFSPSTFHPLLKKQRVSGPCSFGAEADHAEAYMDVYPDTAG